MTAVRPLRRDAAENRERILVAAAQVFAEGGPDAGVEEVARAAGVGMGTLYRRFPTKQAVVDELVAALRARLAALGRAARDLPDDEALDHLVTGSVGLMYAGRGCLHQLWHQTEAGLDDLVEFRATVAELLSRAQRAGVARPELVPSDIAVALWALRGIIEVTQTDAPEAWRRHLEITLAGIRPTTVRLAHPPLTPAQFAALTVGPRPPDRVPVGRVPVGRVPVDRVPVGRVPVDRVPAAQTSTTMGKSIGRRR